MRFAEMGLVVLAYVCRQRISRRALPCIQVPTSESVIPCANARPRRHGLLVAAGAIVVIRYPIVLRTHTLVATDKAGQVIRIPLLQRVPILTAAIWIC